MTYLILAGLLACAAVISLIIYLVITDKPRSSNCTGKCDQGRNCTCQDWDSV